MKEKVLIVGDSISAPTGFSVNGMNIAWALSDIYDVHYLGLQAFQTQKIKVMLEGKERELTHHANIPRDESAQWDFGTQSLPALLDKLEPELLITINDIQMIAHIPNVMCPDTIKLKVIDTPSKEYLSDYTIKSELEGEIQKFKERFPRNTKWIAYCPQDGDPPMPNWKNIYRMADKVVAMAKYGQDVFKKHYNMDVPFIWHGVDSNVFKPMDKPEKLEGQFILGDINRNQPRKQPIRIIEAFARFAKDKDDVLLHMQKDWNDRFGWPLKYFTDRYGITTKCIKPAKVGMSREEVAKVYNAWDVNLMCTAGEGFGLAFAESMMCGVPNIACDYTTSKELIDDGWPRPRGLLTKYDLVWEKLDVAAVRRSYVDIQDLVEKMNYYYYNRDKLEKHSENAHKWAQKNLNMNTIGDQWLDLVKNVVEEE